MTGSRAAASPPTLRAAAVSPGAVTLICREGRAWLSRETAERIVAETDGAVTPNDFLHEASKGRKGPDMHHPVTAAIEACARGEIVVVTDADDRENEGDLIVAASLCTTEKMAPSSATPAASCAHH